MEEGKHIHIWGGQPDGFHLQDGWYFKRMECGCVRICKYANSSPRSSLKIVDFVDEMGWASIVASVSARGENADTFETARNFHNHPKTE